MHDAWFFVGIFAFIFLVWIATGGPTNPLAFSGPTLAQPGALGGGTYLSLPQAPFGVGGNEVQLPGSSYGGGSVGTGGTTGGSVPAFKGGTFGTPSLYRGKVTLNHSVSNAGTLSESLELRVAYDAGVPVDITGWRIQSDASGSAAVIPKGTDVPSSGTVNAVQDIVLKPGERAIISSGYSPIGGSFRENKCIGYFSTYQKFNPALPQNCPAAEDELVEKYGAGYLREAACVTYVEKLNRCQVALTPPPGTSSGCQAFIVKYLNYNGCVEAHRNDADFDGKTWRVYLGRSTPIFRTQRELVKLLDKEGNTVDAFAY